MQKTDLNVAPYYDDFESSDDFHRVLFRPGFAVQARELTTLQSILQNQIEKHGRHMFKEGTIVIPGHVSYTDKYYAVKLQTNGFPSGNVDDYLSTFVGAILTGSLSGVTARVIAVESGTTTDSPTLYVNYLSTASKSEDATASNGESVMNVTSTFVDGEHLQSNTVINSLSVGSNTAILLTSGATATGSSANIQEGVYFVRGQFVRVTEQRIILDKYTNTPSYRVGLTVNETLITPEADSTLLDNATGTSNVNAKGAHRLKVTLTLSKLAIGSAADENFIELMRIKNGVVQQIITRTDYNIFADNLARRTFEESGNYAVRPFGVDVRESLDDGSNNGIYTSVQTTDEGNTPSESLATIQIDPGKAYIRGYEVQTVVPTYLDLEKPRNTDNFDSAITNMEVGNIVRVNNVFGSPDINDNGSTINTSYRSIDLFNLVNASRGSAIGTVVNKIGVARARAFEHHSGNESAGTALVSTSSVKTAQYNLYLFDVRMFTVLKLNATISAGATVGAKVTGATSGASGFIHSVIQTSSSNDTLNLITTSGTFTAGEELKSTGIANSGLVQHSGGDSTISTITVHNFNDSVKSVFSDCNTGAKFTADTLLDNTLTLGGTVTTDGSSNQTTVNGFGTTFTKDLKEGDFIEIPGAGQSGATLSVRVTVVTDDTTITIASNALTTATTVPIIRKRAQLIDQEKNISLRKLRKDVIKTLKTDDNSGRSQTSVTYRKQFIATANSSGVVTFTGDNTETFAAESNTDFVCHIVTAAGSGGGAAGDIVNIEATGMTFNASGNSLTLTSTAAFGNGATVKLTATMTRTLTQEKTKTRNAAHVVLVDADAISGAPEYGTASQHKEISLGIADAYKLYAVLDSESTSTNPTLPSSALSSLSGTLQRGEIITGGQSNCTAVYIATNSGSAVYVVTNNRAFISGETVTGGTSGATFQIGAFTAGSKNITSDFTLDTGQRDNFYDISRVVRKGGRPTPAGKLLIVCDYFSHGNGDIFTVDSYSTIDYKDIPIYTSTRVDPETRAPSGEFSLSDTVDFRPRVKDATTSNVTIQSIVTKQVTSKSFDFTFREFTGTGSSQISIPKDNSQFQYDFDFFLGRRDLLFISELGKFIHIKGVDSEEPEFPASVEKAMLLATIELPAYVLDIDDIIYQKTQNRRYTMRDIGKLEDRINTIEYYTSLNLLEKDAKSFQVQDENGLDRFKSGFVVDNFSGHSVGDVQNEDYKNSVDYINKELRPKYYMKGVTLKEENTTEAQRTVDSYQKTGDMVTLPYTDVVSIEQPYGTRVENLNPVLTFSWAGICTLNPSGDEWFEVDRLPALIINREGNFDQLVAQVGNALGTIWGAWGQAWTGVSVTQSNLGSSTRITRVGRRQTTWRDTVTRTTTSTTTTRNRTGVNTQVIEQIDHESLGDKVRGTALIPFMRSVNVTFSVEGMKPFTKVYPFFDKVNVTPYVTPTFGGVGTSTTLGGTMVTNGNGTIKGTFLIPDPNVTGNPKFRTGERLFRLTSSATDTTNPEPITFAQAMFSSTGILRTLQEEIIATRNGRIEVTQVSDSTSTTVNENVDVTTTEEIAVQFFDPLAQTFKTTETGGEMITKINVFFQRKDASVPVLCQIREVDNGFPTIRQLPFAGKMLNPYLDGTVTTTVGSTTITGTDTDFLTGTHNLKVGDTITINGAGSSTSGVIGYEGYDTTALITTVTGITSDTSLTVADAPTVAGSSKKISNINLSSTATDPTTFRFDAPVYIKPDVEYCVVLFTQCESYFSWISRMGEQDIGGTRMISKQPHLGVLFKSQNNHTWTSYQFEDMKFTIFRAQFDTSTNGVLTLTNDVLPTKTLARDPIRTFDSSNLIQVTHSDHGMHDSSNNVTISGASCGKTGVLSSTIAANATSLTLNAGHGFVQSNLSNRTYVKIGDEIMYGTLQNTNDIANLTRADDGTTAVEHTGGAIVELYQIAKIPLTLINTTHNAVANTDVDSYTITVSGVNATGSLSSGGTSVTATENAVMDSMQTLLPTIEFPDTSISSKVRTTTGTSPNGSETSFSLQSATAAKTITLDETINFNNPQLIASGLNETQEMAGSKSFFLDVTLSSSNQNVSPIIDLDRKSIVAINNRLNKIDSATDMGVSALQGDYVASTNPSGDVNEGIYITRKVALDNPATAIKVVLDMNRFPSASVKLMYKVLRSDDASDFDEIGYNFFNTDGSPDSTVNASSTSDDYREYQYTAGRKTDGTGEPLDEFIAFAIKIVMQGTNTSEPPRIKDLRAIALAT